MEGTEDEVILGSQPVPDAVFSDVLAEAEAAVSGAQLSEHSDEGASDGVRPRRESARVEGLRRSLTALGVPAAYLPDEAESSLDGLHRRLSVLPAGPPLPTRPGSVIVVVGGGRDVRAAAQLAVTSLGLEASSLLEAERTYPGRERVRRRRSRRKTTVVVVDASLSSRSLAGVASWIKTLKADLVLGAVPATAKRSDIERWQAQLGGVDALALSGLATTATPGELMGVLPIRFIDGVEASALRWVSILLANLLERGA